MMASCWPAFSPAFFGRMDLCASSEYFEDTDTSASSAMFLRRERFAAYEGITCDFLVVLWNGATGCRSPCGLRAGREIWPQCLRFPYDTSVVWVSCVSWVTRP